MTSIFPRPKKLHCDVLTTLQQIVKSKYRCQHTIPCVVHLHFTEMISQKMDVCQYYVGHSDGAWILLWYTLLCKYTTVKRTTMTFYPFFSKREKWASIDKSLPSTIPCLSTFTGTLRAVPYWVTFACHRGYLSAILLLSWLKFSLSWSPRIVQKAKFP